MMSAGLQNELRPSCVPWYLWPGQSTTQRWRSPVRVRATLGSRSAKWAATHERTAHAGGALFSPRVRQGAGGQGAGGQGAGGQGAGGAGSRWGREQVAGTVSSWIFGTFHGFPLSLFGRLCILLHGSSCFLLDLFRRHRCPIRCLRSRESPGAQPSHPFS